MMDRETVVPRKRLLLGNGMGKEKKRAPPRRSAPRRDIPAQSFFLAVAEKFHIIYRSRKSLAIYVKTENFEDFLASFTALKNFLTFYRTKDR
ncbi:hypothetical protein FE782_30195 [Paenibacillus antri]|uniref:Uncharacterized protein n=1 Tax=Paenibacillus antri TaxID=2582848 RepID=A0A5R9G6A7_9BACL|nr:hypothetical protein [Paenibacillus antri]TLS48494.1 hypothetical protein FE782_30195 [Paenibacillus antri]